MSVLNTFHYKQYLFILTFSKCNGYYRPDLHNLQTRRKNSKELLVVANEDSANVKTKNTFKYYFPSFLLCLKNA